MGRVVRIMGVGVFGFCLSVPAGFTQAQTQISLGASKDNTLYESATGALSNGSGQTFFVGRTNQASGSIRRGLIAFDIAGNVPPSATILTARLTLNASRTNFSSPATSVGLHRALASWGEGDSDAGANEGQGAPADSNDATWIHRFYSSSNWTSAGGDFAGAPSATQTVGGTGSYTWGSTAQMVTDVQLWLNDSSSNHGWVLIGEEEGATTAKRFDSRESLDSTARPRLDVTYQVTSTGVVRVDETPAAFALAQNYPNPFNPSTIIEFALPARSFVTLAVYNPAGQLIRTLVSQETDAGRHSVLFDARGLASGTYLYRLSFGSDVQTRAMVLVR